MRGSMVAREIDLEEKQVYVPIGDHDAKQGGELGNLKIYFSTMPSFSNLSKTYAKDKLSKCATMVLLVCCYLYRKKE